MNIDLPIHRTMRHPRTGEPIRALGLGRRGPIWPIIGASDDDPGADEPAPDPEGGDDPDDGADEPEIHRQATREAAKFRRELKPWRELAKDLGGLTPEQVREALSKASKPGPDDGADPVDADEVRRQAKLEARQESDARIIRSEVRALAAESFANPKDALHNLDLSEYEVDDDGELVDLDQVKTDLADVLKKNPHYSKTGKVPKPDPSQGGKEPQKVDPGPGVARLRAAYAESN